MGQKYSKKNTVVTFNTKTSSSKKNKAKEKFHDRSTRRPKNISIDSGTDPEDYYDEDLTEEGKSSLLKKKSKKRNESNSHSTSQDGIHEMKTDLVNLKGKNNSQKLADILSVLKMTNIDRKKEKNKTSKKATEHLFFHDIPTDDIILTTDDETTESQIKPEQENIVELLDNVEKNEKPNRQSSVDTINLNQLFSPTKKTEDTHSIFQDKNETKIVLDLAQSEKQIKSNEEKHEAEEMPHLDIIETVKEPEVKFAKINIGGDPKKVENVVQKKSEKKQKTAETTGLIHETEEKRLSSAGSSSSSSSGAELYVRTRTTQKH